ncbi:MAG TPA: hypothetical protein VFW00_06985 [Rhodocyclaceae bacterium]|nr:hypothetical protein [Rhodocyclaceae bacterium]
MPDREIDTRGVVIGGSGILAAVVVAILATFLLLAYWHISARGGSGASLDAPIAGANLEEAPQPALETYLESKRRQLDAYGWVDAQHRIAHIPIDAAMQLLVERSRNTNSNNASKPATRRSARP